MPGAAGRVKNEKEYGRGDILTDFQFDLKF